MTKEWAHDDLMRDLADHLRTNSGRMVWCDMQLGGMHSERPDVYTINKSYSKPMPLAYEIKVSISDFRSDITTGKWQKYLQEASGVVFAVPKGLVTKKDIPIGCGLMTRSESGWSTVKRPTIQKVQLSQHIMLKFLIDGVDRVEKPKPIHPRCATEWEAVSVLRKKIGEEVADYMRDKFLCADRLGRLKQQEVELQVSIQKHQDQKKEIIQKMKIEALEKLDEQEEFIQHTVNELKRELNLPLDAGQWDVIHAIRKLIKLIDGDERTKVAHNVLDRIMNDINFAKAELGKPDDKNKELG